MLYVRVVLVKHSVVALNPECEIDQKYYAVDDRIGKDGVVDPHRLGNGVEDHSQQVGRHCEYDTFRGAPSAIEKLRSEAESRRNGCHIEQNEQVRDEVLADYGCCIEDQIFYLQKTPINQDYSAQLFESRRIFAKQSAETLCRKPHRDKSVYEIK